jgi:multidrug efflux pump subunit AcrA (membrane-fusion protein)
MAGFRFTPQDKDRRELPEQALPPNQELVWVWDNDTQSLRAVNVRIGTVDGIHAAVLTAAATALKEGDAVVTAEVLDAPRKRTFGMKLGF